MDEDFGSDFYTVTDDDGKELTLEHLGTLEVEDETYMAFVPADMDEEDPDYGIVILKVAEEDGEEMFVTIDDDAVLNTVHEMFVEELFENEE